MSTKILFGIETEFALCACSSQDGTVSEIRHRVLEELMAMVRRRHPHLTDGGSGSGIFLANGSRLYVDAGGHPELCTPECLTPTEVARWLFAGERILRDVLVDLQLRHPELEIALNKCNVDYSGSEATWGSHESYAIRRGQREIAPHLISHLVTRIVYSGAGGFDNCRDDRPFLISPRVPHLRTPVAWSPGDQRALVHNRQEPLSSGQYDRIHLMSGESNSSELSVYLRVGTTALVTKLADVGMSVGADLAFQSPIHALRSYAQDPTCRIAMHLRDGRRLSALEVQRLYLENVETHLGEGLLPDWAPEVCALWRRTLDRLEGGYEAVATTLDWAIKRTLFDGHTRGRAIDERLHAELAEIDTRYGQLGPTSIFTKLDEAGALDHSVPGIRPIEGAISEPPPGARAQARGRAIAELSGRSDCHAYWDLVHDQGQRRHLDLGDPFDASPSWEHLPPLLSHRARPDPRGPWSELAGRPPFLASRTPSTESIDGTLIPYERSLEDALLEDGPCPGGHDSLDDLPLDDLPLDDLPLDDPPFDGQSPLHSGPHVGLAEGIDQYQALHLDRATTLLRDAVTRTAAVCSGEQHVLARFWYACALHDLGLVERARVAIEPALEAAYRLDGAATLARVATRYALIQIEEPAPLQDIEGTLDRAEEACAARDSQIGRSRFHQVRGRLYAARGHYSEATELFERSLREHHPDPVAFAKSTYLRWLARICLRHGDPERALTYIEEWQAHRRAGEERERGPYLGAEESQVELALGRAPAAYDIADRLLERPLEGPLHRYRVDACCAFIHAAIALGRIDEAQPVVTELLQWHDIGIVELRYDITRAHLAWASARLDPGAPLDIPAMQLPLLDPVPSSPQAVVRQLWRIADLMDERLDTAYWRTDLQRMLEGPELAEASSLSA